MSKRAYSPREISQMKHTPIPWEGEWREVFGQPDITDTWIIHGPSAGGKSSFTMQLAKKLCEYGGVLYVSLEEKLSMSFQQRIRRYHMEEVQSKFRVTDDGDLTHLKDRLRKRKSARFIIVDSFQVAQQVAGWDYPQTAALIDEFPRKCFIFISQEQKSEPLGKGAVRLKYLAGVKVRVKGYKAQCQGRFIDEAGAEFHVWEDGIIQTSNNE
jgi:predicted ATP-dependent serine protease